MSSSLALARTSGSVASMMVVIEKLAGFYHALPQLTQAHFSKMMSAGYKYAPSVFKYLFYFLLLINVRSLPLGWHIRIFRPVFSIRFQHRLLKLRTLFLPRSTRDVYEDRWLDTLCLIGQHPIKTTVLYKSWASIDDCDFNGHLSNSSYAKTCDAARFKAALQMFPMFFRAGGWMALAATQYDFIREIPMFASYEVRVKLHAWDQKWVYIVCKFVTKPKKKRTIKSQAGAESPVASEDTDAAFTASLRTPASGELSVAPGTPSGYDSAVTASQSDQEAQRALQAALSQGLSVTSSSTSASLNNDKARFAKLVQEEPDGAILHTVCISQLCFKVGRITVPPAIALACNGLPVFSSKDESDRVYSRENPPPSWKEAKKMMARPLGGSPKRLREFFKGGWKEVPESERWWEGKGGLVGDVEERRKVGLQMMESLTRSTASARY
ncbi:hypothetical protein AX17_003837 [Amanita inopinata Kibby_2008]|nr:hypothetical protein AX17_003837 [Amanita inopinata Kibby_2008]